MLCLNVMRGCGDHSPLTRPKEEVTHGGPKKQVVAGAMSTVYGVSFLIVGGLYSITALRKTSGPPRCSGVSFKRRGFLMVL